MLRFMLLGHLKMLPKAGPVVVDKGQPGYMLYVHSYPVVVPWPRAYKSAMKRVHCKKKPNIFFICFCYWNTFHTLASWHDCTWLQRLFCAWRVTFANGMLCLSYTYQRHDLLLWFTYDMLEGTLLTFQGQPQGIVGIQLMCIAYSSNTLHWMYYSGGFLAKQSNHDIVP